MARLWTCGFETGDDVRLYFDSTNTSYFAVSSDQARTGSYALRVRHTQYNRASQKLISPSPSDEIYLSFGLRQDASGDHLDLLSISDFLMQKMPSTNYLRFVITEGTFDLDFGLTAGVWYWVEIRFKKSATAGILQVKVDGNLCLDQQNINTGEGAIAEFSFRAHLISGSAGHYTYVDDVAINDTSGAADNSWSGDVHLEPLLPNASGDLSQWALHPNTGESDFQDIDERPPDDDATYLYDSVDGQQFLVNLQDWDGAGKSPRKVHIWACARKESAEGGDQIKLIAKQGGVTEVGPAELLLTSYALQSYTMNNAPDGGAWSDAKIDALQIGAEVEIVP